MDMRLTAQPQKERSMTRSMEDHIRALEKLPASALRARYRELFGEESGSRNRQFLFRRVAWRMQALAEGGLSERAKQRALEIANDADLRMQAPKGYRHFVEASGTDSRLPESGTVLRRTFKDRHVEVKVLDSGFEFEGRTYPSLSAIASRVAGCRWHGFAFFGLNGTRSKTA